MSNLKVTNIQSKGTGFNDVVSFQNDSGTENGTLCRAFVNFDGTFGTSPFTTANGGIRAAFNVSSVTDIALGQYTANFTNAMPDTNYAAVAMSYYGDVTNENGYLTLEDGRLAARTTSSFTLATTTTSVYNDSAITSIVIFR